MLCMDSALGIVHSFCHAPALLQALTLLLMGPMIDKLVSHMWVFKYQWTGGGCARQRLWQRIQGCHEPLSNRLAMLCIIAGMQAPPSSCWPPAPWQCWST